MSLGTCCVGAVLLGKRNGHPCGDFGQHRVMEAVLFTSNEAPTSTIELLGGTVEHTNA